MPRRWFRISLITVVAFTAVVLWWAFQPWSDHQALVTPPDERPQSISFRCAAPFSDQVSGTLEGEPPGFPLSREPCRGHGQRRTLAVVDLGVAGAAAAALVRVGRRRDTAGPDPRATASTPGA